MNPFFRGALGVVLLTAAVSVPALLWGGRSAEKDLPEKPLKEASAATGSYELLEPETWIGKELPILEHIDIADQLKKGNWLVMLYHHDCPACTEAIPQIEQMAQELEGNEDFLRFALVEVPPYGIKETSCHVNIKTGRLDTSKEWFVTTPVFALIYDSHVKQSWIEKAPPLQGLMHGFEQTEQKY